MTDESTSSENPPPEPAASELVAESDAAPSSVVVNGVEGASASAAETKSVAEQSPEERPVADADSGRAAEPDAAGNLSESDASTAPPESSDEPEKAESSESSPPSLDERPAAESEGIEPVAPKPRTRKPRAAKTVEDDVEQSPSESTHEESLAPSEGAASEGEPVSAVPESSKKWYVVKVQSGREESIKSAIERKVKIEGLEAFYSQIAIPVEEYVEKKKVRVTDKKTGDKVTQEKNVTKARKKYPGYLFAEVEFNENILYLFRETSGVGDFVGATGPMKPPPPMNEREVTQMLTGIVDPKDRGKKPGKTVIKLDFEKGDKVKIRDGAFANMEGEVKSITEPKDATETPKVTVVVSIFGRPVDVELDYWQVDKA